MKTTSEIIRDAFNNAKMIMSPAGKRSYIYGVIDTLFDLERINADEWNELKQRMLELYPCKED